MFELCPQLDAISPDGFKDCLAQQQFASVFDAHSRIRFRFVGFKCHVIAFATIDDNHAAAN